MPAFSLESKGYHIGSVPAFYVPLIAEAAGLARKVATPFDNTDFQAQWGGMVDGWVAGFLGRQSP